MSEMSGGSGITLTVANRLAGADGVVVLELRSLTGARLPSWQPGAHIDLLLPGGLIRQYSLCGDPRDHGSYRIAVLFEENGRGGSRFIHDELRAGDEVRIRGPRNQFGLVSSEKYIFIAGGIGITPILPMLSAADAAGADWRLHYGGRYRRSMAFLDALQQWPSSRIHLYPQDEVGLINLEPVIEDAKADPRVHLYCCGPGALINAVQAAVGAVPPSHLHVELFRPTDDTVGPALPFDVELVRSGLHLTVPGDTSLLETLLAAGVDVQYSCESGSCGTCEMTVLEGEVDHRDTLLTTEERHANNTIYPCVSRSKGDRLVLDA
jgi:ferredoxin-NADP reductase